MLSRIFPRQFDNIYRGHWLGLWLFVAVMFVKGLQGVNSIVTTRQVMTTADGIPLDSFNAVAAQAAIGMFTLLGMYLLILPVQGAVAVIRYRSMIPFLYLMLLIAQAASRLLVLWHPVIQSGQLPIGFVVNLVILAVTLLGFVLSLLGKSDSPGRPAVDGVR